MKLSDTGKAHSLTIGFFVVITIIVGLMIAFPIMIFVVLGVLAFSTFYSTILNIAKGAIEDAKN